MTIHNFLTSPVSLIRVKFSLRASSSPCKYVAAMDTLYVLANIKLDALCIH